MEVGEQLKIGNHVFTISDVALSEPDRPLGMWGVSPRIFTSFEGLDATGLLRPDSYLERRIHIRLQDSSKASEVAEQLRQVGAPIRSVSRPGSGRRSTWRDTLKTSSPFSI